MSARAETNIGVAHGEWGENVAADYLRQTGRIIVERNVHPLARDRRLEIDIIAYDRTLDTIIFVEVKQHKEHSPYQRRLRSVNRRKRDLLRRACNAWRLHNHWQGGYRFDVIEVYGTPETGYPEIDHIERVDLFTPQERFVHWT